MNQRIKLANSATERMRYDNLAELYAILVSIEQLELAFVRDSISKDEYTDECSKLLVQYKSVYNIVGKDIGDLNEFAKMYKLECPAAFSRIEIGVPSTVEHMGGGKTDGTIGGGNAGGNSGGNGRSTGMISNAAQVAHTVQAYITLMDSIKLSMVAVDELHPLMGELAHSLTSLGFVPPDFLARTKIREWLITLNKMKASEELDNDQIRQLSFDMDNSYREFYLILNNINSSK